MLTLYTHQIPAMITDEVVQAALERLDPDNTLERLEIRLEEARLTVLVRREAGRWVADQRTAQLPVTFHAAQVLDGNGEVLLPQDYAPLVLGRVSEALAKG